MILKYWENDLRIGYSNSIQTKQKFYYQKLKICTVEMNLQTMEWGARWYGSYIPSFTKSILR